MRSATPQQRAQLATITRELETMQLDGTDVVNDVLPVVRSMLDVESIGVYSVREHVTGWQFDRWSLHEMPAARIREGMLRLFERRDVPVLFYDVARPAASQRNRLIEATAMIDACHPGGWQAAPLCREVLAPAGLGHQQQHRILLCEGASLLAWFGAFHCGLLSPTQQRLMQAAGRALRVRLATERLLEAMPRKFAVLEAALAHIAGAAFVLDTRGTIAAANVAGRHWLATCDRDARETLRDAIAGRSAEFAITEIREKGVARHYLAVAQLTTTARIELAIARAVQRWALTPKQTEVLALIARGMSNTAIAAELTCSLRTVELHVTALLDRAGVDNRAALVSALLLL